MNNSQNMNQNQNMNQSGQMKMNQSQGQSQQGSQNKIANPSSNVLPQVKGPEMNDRDRVNDVLATEKYLAYNVNIAAWEASHSQLHQDLMTVLQDTQACHRELFELMFQHGWYKLEAEEQQKLNQAYQQFSNYSTQFPYSTQVQ